MLGFLEQKQMSEMWRKWKSLFLTICLQVAYAGLDILSKVALNEGMSSYIFVVYRHASAFVVMAPFAIVLGRNSWRNMTVSIFIKLMILALLEPVIGQNLYILGMRATTATFTVSMSNVLPAITFVIAWILRLEVVNLKSIRSQAKVAGTLTTVAGAMIMTLVKGPLLELFWTKGRTNKKEEMHNGVDLQHSLKGAIMIVIGCFGWSCFVILQSYPDELAMTAWICLLATIEGAIAALIMERGNPAVWAIKWNTTLLATLYCGTICSGAVYYVQGIIMRERGPVFVTAFNPLCMIIVAVMGSIFLAEKTYLGRRVLGAVVIVVGLYMVDWGKSKEQEQEHKDPSISMDEHTTPENQILGEESETNCNDQVIAIKTSDEICDEHDGFDRRVRVRHAWGWVVSLLFVLFLLVKCVTIYYMFTKLLLITVVLFVNYDLTII